VRVIFGFMRGDQGRGERHADALEVGYQRAQPRSIEPAGGSGDAHGRDDLAAWIAHWHSQAADAFFLLLVVDRVTALTDRL